jgi:hypothetical protein
VEISNVDNPQTANSFTTAFSNAAIERSTTDAQERILNENVNRLRLSQVTAVIGKLNATSYVTTVV